MKISKIFRISMLLISVLSVAISSSAQILSNEEEAKPMGWDSVFYGKALPPFDMKTPDGEVLKLEELKGKVIVLDFWATWCKPCHILTHELDSALKKYSTDQLVVIGLNHQEEQIKGGDPLGYWKNSGYHFPMTLHNDAYGKLLGAGFPSAFVIDQNGIVAGRFDGLTPTTAGEIDVLVWEILNKPEVNEEVMTNALKAGEPVKALYMYNKLVAIKPEFRKKLHTEYLHAVFLTNPWMGVNLSKAWRKETKDADTALYTIGKLIAGSDIAEPAINAYGLQTLKTLQSAYPKYKADPLLKGYIAKMTMRVKTTHKNLSKSHK